jgi:hypothetical protein
VPARKKWKKPCASAGRFPQKAAASRTDIQEVLKAAFGYREFLIIWKNK